MTILEIALLLGGCFILIFGIILAFFHRAWKRYYYFVLISIGIILIYIPTLGPLSGIKKRISAITEINSSEVESIVLQPTRRKDYNVYSLVEKDSVITDRNSIDEICEKLRMTKVIGPEYDENRGRTWSTGKPSYSERLACRVGINYFNRKVVTFGITKAADATKISLNSNGEFGWHYANLEAYQLGEILMRFSSKTDY